MRSFSFWVFLGLDFTYKKQQRSFGSGRHWAFFLEGGGSGEFGNNNFSKKRQIELTFWPELVLIVVQRYFEKIEFLKLPNILSFWSKFDSKLPPENGQNQKLENFLIISKEKIFIAHRKNLYIVNYWWTGLCL